MIDTLVLATTVGSIALLNTTTRTDSPRKLRLFASRIRQMLPTTFAYCTLVVFGGLFMATRASTTTAVLVESTAVGVAAMALVVWGQWFINDVYDRETDEYSNPGRETTRGAITDREALVVGGALVVVALALTLVRNGLAFACLAGYAAVNTAYTVPPLRTKSGAVSSMVTLGTMGALSFLLGATAVRPVVAPLGVGVAFAILFFMSLTMSYKDIKDAEHDARSGVENFAVKYGPDRVRRALMVLLPASYVAMSLLLELYLPIPAFLLAGAYVVYLLYTWEGDNDIVYKIDAVNGVYLLALGVSYYLLN